MKGSRDNPCLWLESPQTGGPGTEHVHVLYKRQYEFDLSSSSPSSPGIGFKGEVKTDPLDRKPLFILMSFQVNSRDFYLDSVENLERDRSILSLVPVTMRAVSLGLTLLASYYFCHLGNIFCSFPLPIQEERHRVITVASCSPISIPTAPKAKPGWCVLRMHPIIKMVIY